jgi:RHS repeat-associated protein
LKHFSSDRVGAAALALPLSCRMPVAALTLALLLLLLLPLQALAQCDARLQCCATAAPGGTPSCGGSGPVERPFSGPARGAGNPLDIISGNKYQRETDLPALPGVLGLELVRHYNSAMTHRAAGRLGQGWRLSYQAELRDGVESLTIVQADGTTQRFLRGIAHPDTYTSADPRQGRVQRLRSPAGPHHVWTWPGGRQLRFELGRLVSIKEASGEEVTLFHTVHGRLVGVRDPQGRELTLHHDAGGRITAIDTPVGRYTYAYDGKPANLVQVTMPGEGRVMLTYHYEDTRHAHALTGISASGTGSDGRQMSQRLMTWGYDDKGHAVSSVKGDGRDGIERVTVQRRHQGDGGEVTLTNANGHATVYRWRAMAGQARLLEAVGPGCASCGATNVRYGYDRFGRLTEVTQLDDHGRPSRTELHALDPLGRVVTTSRIAYQGGKAQPPMQVVRYGYADTRSDMPSLIVRRSVIAGREHTVRIEHNERRQVTSVTEEGWSPLDADLRPVAAGAPLKRTTRYVYTRIGWHSVLTHVDGPLPNGPLGTPQDSDVTEIRYDERGGRVLEVTHPTGLRATYLHDAAGRVVQHAPTDGVPVQLTIDMAGRVVRSQRGAETQALLRDAAGRITRLERNDGTRYAVSYDHAGRLEAITDAQGSRQEVRFDAESNVVQTQARDAAGNVPFDEVRYEYDPAGRLVADNRGNHRTYDLLGRLIRETDPLGRRSIYQYDALGRQVVQEERARGPQIARMRKTALDDNDDIRAVTRLHYRNDRAEASEIVAANGATTAMEQDDFGRTVRLISPDTGTTVAKFDEADRIVQLVDAVGNRFRYTHDSLGRMIERTISHPERPGATDRAEWRYEGANLVESSNQHQADRYRWDVHGRLVRKTVHLRTSGPGSAGHLFETRYRYDDAGRLSEKRLPDGLVVVHRYDAHGRESAVLLRYPNGQEQPIIASVVSDAVHGVRELTFGNGVVTANARDRRGRLVGIATAARRSGGPPEPLYSQRIIYDAADRIVAIDRDGRSEVYGYDGFNRLVEVDTPHEHRRFRYDLVGNRTEAWERGSRAVGSFAASDFRRESSSYSSKSNRLLRMVQEGTTSTGGHEALWQYDEAGSPIQIGDRRYRYGASGRLEEVFDSDRHLATYRYNADGERVSKSVRGRTTHFIYDEHRIVAEADDAGRITAHYLFQEATPVAKIETSQEVTLNAASVAVEPSGWQTAGAWIRSHFQDGDEPDTPASLKALRLLYVHTDHLGTPRVLSDSRQRTVWKATYDAFGRATVEDDPDGDGQSVRLSVRSPGQYLDEETGTHYNYLRDYDAQTGRFLQSDPIGLAGGIATYSYVANSPLSHVDPYGLAQCTFTMSTGRLTCAPTNPNNAPVNIPVASGNNGNGQVCRNNPACTSVRSHGPIPLGCWTWTQGKSRKPNGRVLEPCSGTTTNARELRTDIRSHSCAYPFGPGVSQPYCSEGCVTGTAADIMALNRLIDAEPGSILHVVP